ncbi:MAG: HlyD family type I secretion periplasmic adaptor subunit [Alphaproteobacteria bacterium]
MSRLDDLLDIHPVPTGRPTAWLVMMAMAALLMWSRVAKLDEVAIAEGEVVPAGQVKVVQHLEGGIIREIFVSEGSTVKAGDPLMLLDLSATSLNRDELQVRLDGLVLSKARLVAEASDKPLAFPPEEEARHPRLVEAERQAYDGRRREQESARSVLERQMAQKEGEVRELESKHRTVTASLAIVKQRLEMSTNLLKDGLTSKMEHLQLKNEASNLSGEIATLEQSIPRARNAINEVRERILQGKNIYRREIADQLNQVEIGIASSRENLAKATDQQRRTQIMSPIDGIVKNLRYNTLGGVVQPGEPVLELVPTGGNLVVEAKLNPMDRGYVEAGQPTMVKISTYDFARYGGLKGKVEMVAPDSTIGPEGQSYFRVLARTEKTWLGSREGDLPISPGMQATVEIHTGYRTVLDYLIRPVLKVRHEAFRER